MGSGRPAPDQVDYKPPWSPQPTQESQMLPTTTRQKKTTDPARRVSKASILPDPLRTVKTPTSKSTQHHPSSSSEYVYKHTSSSRANYPTSYGHDSGDPRPSSSRHPELKSSKAKTPKSSFDHVTSPVSPNAALAMPYPGLTHPVSKTTDPSIRKSSKSRDKDREKDTHGGRERERPFDAHTKASREASRDPYDSRQQIHHSATLGRDFKERPEEHITLKSSGHRRRLTEDDAMTLKSPRQGENNRPAILPSQPPVQSSSVPQPQFPDQSRGLATPMVTNKYSPPPAPLVAPVWLPQRSKGKDKTKGGQETLASGSDTERENRGLRTMRGDGSQETLAQSKPKKESKMSLTGWFGRKPPRPVIGSPIMPTPASNLFSPLPETVLPPPHLISLQAGQGPSDSPYDLSHKTQGVAGRTFNALETFAKKHNRSHSAHPTTSSSRPSANGHDSHGQLRSQISPIPQTPIIGTYVHSQPHRSHPTPLVGPSQALHPEQSSRTGYGSAQDVRAYSTDTIRSPQPGHPPEPNYPPTSYQKDSYTGRNRSKDSVVAGQTGSVSGTIKSKRKPVPLHNIFPDGTVEYATPVTSVPAPAQIHPQTHDPPALDVSPSKRDSVPPIPVPPPQPQSAPVNVSFSAATPVATTGLLAAEPQPVPATSNGSHPDLSITDIYPAGYATTGKHGERSDKDREKEKGKKDRKRKKYKESPTLATDGEHTVLTAKDSPLLATPLVTTSSGSSRVPGLLEVNGANFTNVSSAMSPNPPLEQEIQDQAPQPHPTPGMGTSTIQNSLQVPSPQHRSTSRQTPNSPNSQPQSQRLSPKPSPTGSYLTVPSHSNQPSPTTKNGKYDMRIQQDGPDTPSSSSTVMMYTPPMNSSRVTLKDAKSTHSYSPVRKDDQLYPHSGPHAVGKGSTGTVDTVADPSAYERGYAKQKSYSYSQEQATGSGSGSSREQLVQLPVRSNTEPAAPSRSTVQNHPYLSPASRSTQQQDPYGSGQSLVRPAVNHTERHERKRTSSQDTIEHDSRYRERERDRERARERDREHDRERDRDRDRTSRRDHRGQHAWPPTSTSNEGTLHRIPPNVDNKVAPTADTNKRLSSTHPYSHQSHSATPAHTHTSSQQGTTGRSSRTTSKTIGHSRAASDPYSISQPPSNRVAVSGILSTPAPMKEQLPPSTPVQDPQQLKSASTQTLTTKQSSRPPSTHSSGQDSKKKGGLLSLFRSISNPSKTRDPPSTSAPSQPEQRPGKLRRNLSTTKRPVADLEALKSPGSNTTKVVELPGTLPSHQQQYSYSTNATYGSYGTQRNRDTQNNQDVKGNNSQPRGFHPWKLLSKRHRTMSTASMDALDGTMVSLSTPDESVRSSATSGFYPPTRDPLEAAQEWRNQEESEFHDRGTGRRRRPGVTFDEPEDKSDLETPIPVTAIHQRPVAHRRLSRLR